MSEKAPMVYQGHPETGEYVGQNYADPSPLEPGVWLIPGKAFEEAPPEPKEGFAIVHVEGEAQVWTHLEDVRGIVFHTDTGLPTGWTQLGPLPEEYTQETCPGPYHIWSGESWQLDADAERQAQAAQVLATRDGLLGSAGIRIAPLQDAVDLGDASDGEVDSLTRWKQYRVALNRIEQQTGFPVTVDWPTAPS